MNEQGIVIKHSERMVSNHLAKRKLARPPQIPASLCNEIAFIFVGKILLDFRVNNGPMPRVALGGVYSVGIIALPQVVHISCTSRTLQRS